jgi:hypothetical protein
VEKNGRGGGVAKFIEHLLYLQNFPTCLAYMFSLTCKVCFHLY